MVDPDGNKIAAAQLAIDGEIEQRQIARQSVDLESGSNCPDMLLP
jgi:hypothetical protein